MAAIVNELKVIETSGTPTARIRIIGEAILDGGTVIFRIIPGNNDVNLTVPFNTRGLRQIDRWGITCRTAQNATDIKAEKIYSTTYDADILGVNCVTGQTYDWWVEGDFAGA